MSPESKELLDDRVRLLVDLAMEIAEEDEIDFGMLNLDERTVYSMFAPSVIGYLSRGDQHIVEATILKLLVENFVLQKQLLDMRMKQ